jgi:hypothetical protein
MYFQNKTIPWISTELKQSHEGLIEIATPSHVLVNIRYNIPVWRQEAIHKEIFRVSFLFFIR